MASNLTQATRELYDLTWRSAVGYGCPMLTRMLERGKATPWGLGYQQMFQSADMTSLVQEYGPNDPLVGGSKEFIQKPKFFPAYLTIPLEENVDERVINAKKSDAQLLHIAKQNTKLGLQGMRRWIANRIYGCATDTEIDATHTYVQGLVSALLDGTTYGGISRTDGTDSVWQSADCTAWDTAVSISKYNMDRWIDACLMYTEDRGDLLILMGDTLYNRLKGIMEAANAYTPKADKAKQGFESMEYSNVEIAKDYLLDRMTYTGSTNKQGNVTLNHNGTKDINSTAIGDSTYAGLCGVSGTKVGDTNVTVGAGSTYVFVIDLKTWNLLYITDPDRKNAEAPFSVSDYTNQSIMANGVDKWLARAFARLNVVCSMPNRNLMRANVS